MLNNEKPKKQGLIDSEVDGLKRMRENPDELHRGGAGLSRRFGSPALNKNKAKIEQFKQKQMKSSDSDSKPGTEHSTGLSSSQRATIEPTSAVEQSEKSVEQSHGTSSNTEQILSEKLLNTKQENGEPILSDEISNTKPILSREFSNTEQTNTKRILSDENVNSNTKQILSEESVDLSSGELPKQTPTSPNTKRILSKDGSISNINGLEILNTEPILSEVNIQERDARSEYLANTEQDNTKQILSEDFKSDRRPDSNTKRTLSNEEPANTEQSGEYTTNTKQTNTERILSETRSSEESVPRSNTERILSKQESDEQASVIAKPDDGITERILSELKAVKNTAQSMLSKSDEIKVEPKIEPDVPNHSASATQQARPQEAFSNPSFITPSNKSSRVSGVDQETKVISSSNGLGISGSSSVDNQSQKQIPENTGKARPATVSTNTKQTLSRNTKSSLSEDLANTKHSLSKGSPNTEQLLSDDLANTNQTLSEYRAEHLANTEQDLSIDRIDGLEKEFVRFIFNKCRENASLQTGKIKSREISEALGLDTKDPRKAYDQVSNLIYRMTKIKKYVSRLESQKGKTGWTIYGISMSTHQQFLKAEQILSKYLAEHSFTAPINIPIKNHINNNREGKESTQASTPTPSAPVAPVKTITEIYPNLDLSPVKDLGITQKHIFDIKKNKWALDEETLQELVNRFPAYIRSPEMKKATRDTLPSVFMAIVKSKAKDGECVLDYVETEIDLEFEAQMAQLAALKAQKEKRRQQITDAKFEVWKADGVSSEVIAQAPELVRHLPEKLDHWLKHFFVENVLPGLE